MSAVLSQRVIHMADFKRNPAKALQAARPQPLAVLNRKRVAFFVLEAELYKALVEKVDSAELEELARRLASGSGPVAP